MGNCSSNDSRIEPDKDQSCLPVRKLKEDKLTLLSKKTFGALFLVDSKNKKVLKRFGIPQRFNHFARHLRAILELEYNVITGLNSQYFIQHQDLVNDHSYITEYADQGTLSEIVKDPLGYQEKYQTKLTSNFLFDLVINLFLGLHDLHSKRGISYHNLSAKSVLISSNTAKLNGLGLKKDQSLIEINEEKLKQQLSLLRNIRDAYAIAADLLWSGNSSRNREVEMIQILIDQLQMKIQKQWDALAYAAIFYQLRTQLVFRQICYNLYSQNLKTDFQSFTSGSMQEFPTLNTFLKNNSEFNIPKNMLESIEAYLFPKEAGINNASSSTVYLRPSEIPLGYYDLRNSNTPLIDRASYQPNTTYYLNQNSQAVEPPYQNGRQSQTVQDYSTTQTPAVYNSQININSQTRQSQIEPLPNKSSSFTPTFISPTAHTPSIQRPSVFNTNNIIQKPEIVDQNANKNSSVQQTDIIPRKNTLEEQKTLLNEQKTQVNEQKTILTAQKTLFNAQQTKKENQNDSQHKSIDPKSVVISYSMQQYLSVTDLSEQFFGNQNTYLSNTNKTVFVFSSWNEVIPDPESINYLTVPIEISAVKIFNLKDLLFCKMPIKSRGQYEQHKNYFDTEHKIIFSISNDTQIQEVSEKEEYDSPSQIKQRPYTQYQTTTIKDEKDATNSQVIATSQYNNNAQQNQEEKVNQRHLQESSASFSKTGTFLNSADQNSPFQSKVSINRQSYQPTQTCSCKITVFSLEQVLLGRQQIHKMQSLKMVDEFSSCSQKESLYQDLLNEQYKYPLCPLIFFALGYYFYRINGDKHYILQLINKAIELKSERIQAELLAFKLHILVKYKFDNYQSQSQSLLAQIEELALDQERGFDKSDKQKFDNSALKEDQRALLMNKIQQLNQSKESLKRAAQRVDEVLKEREESLYENLQRPEIINDIKEKNLLLAEHEEFVKQTQQDKKMLQENLSEVNKHEMSMTFRIKDSIKLSSSSFINSMKASVEPDLYKRILLYEQTLCQNKANYESIEKLYDIYIEKKDYQKAEFYISMFDLYNIFKLSIALKKAKCMELQQKWEQFISFFQNLIERNVNSDTQEYGGRITYLYIIYIESLIQLQRFKEAEEQMDRWFIMSGCKEQNCILKFCLILLRNNYHEKAKQYYELAKTKYKLSNVLVVLKLYFNEKSTNMQQAQNYHKEAVELLQKEIKLKQSKEVQQQQSQQTQEIDIEKLLKQRILQIPFESIEYKQVFIEYLFGQGKYEELIKEVLIDVQKTHINYDFAIKLIYSFLKQKKPQSVISTYEKYLMQPISYHYYLTYIKLFLMQLQGQSNEDQKQFEDLNQLLIQHYKTETFGDDLQKQFIYCQTNLSFCKYLEEQNKIEQSCQIFLENPIFKGNATLHPEHVEQSFYQCLRFISYFENKSISINSNNINGNYNNQNGSITNEKVVFFTKYAYIFGAYLQEQASYFEPLFLELFSSISEKAAHLNIFPDQIPESYQKQKQTVTFQERQYSRYSTQF